MYTCHVSSYIRKEAEALIKDKQWIEKLKLTNKRIDDASVAVFLIGLACVGLSVIGFFLELFISLEAMPFISLVRIALFVGSMGGVGTSAFLSFVVWHRLWRHINALAQRHDRRTQLLHVLEDQYNMRAVA